MGVLLGAIKLVRNIILCFQDVEKIVPVTMTYQTIKSYSRLENIVKIYIRSTFLILYHTKFVLCYHLYFNENFQVGSFLKFLLEGKERPCKGVPGQK